ncbi:MAG: VC0807 family protein [Kofleriaceae bacterium]
MARREIAKLLVIDAIAPYAVYELARPYTGDLAALALSALPPAIGSVASVVRTRKLDMVSALVLAGIGVSLVLIALGGSERVLLLRDSLITAVVGLVVAISAAFPKPILYFVFRQIQGSDPPLGQMRILSVVLGLGLIVEMAVRTAMVYAMSTSRFLLVSPFVQYGMTGLLVAWAVFYTRRSEHAAAARRARDVGESGR